MKFLLLDRTLFAPSTVSENMINRVRQYLQDYFIDGLEKSFDKPYHKTLQRLSLAPNPALPYDKLQMRVHARLALLFSSAMVLITLLGLAIYFFYLWSSAYAFTYLRGHWRVVFFAISADATIRWSLIVLLSIIPLSTLLWTVIVYPWVWAWNRRADRLSRATTQPQATPDTLPGVWPPPPTRS